MSRKDDDGKVLLGTLLYDFKEALNAVGAVGTDGAARYSLHGWKHVHNGLMRYTNAEFRHLLPVAEDSVDEICLYDRKSGFLHQAHVAWNALAVLQLMLQGDMKLRIEVHHENVNASDDEDSELRYACPQNRPKT